jgi:hypothetical protein
MVAGHLAVGADGHHQRIVAVQRVDIDHAPAAGPGEGVAAAVRGRRRAGDQAGIVEGADEGEAAQARRQGAQAFAAARGAPAEGARQEVGERRAGDDAMAVDGRAARLAAAAGRADVEQAGAGTPDEGMLDAAGGEGAAGHLSQVVQVVCQGLAAQRADILHAAAVIEVAHRAGIGLHRERDLSPGVDARKRGEQAGTQVDHAVGRAVSCIRAGACAVCFSGRL